MNPNTLKKAGKTSGLGLLIGLAMNWATDTSKLLHKLESDVAVLKWEVMGVALAPTVVFPDKNVQFAFPMFPVPDLIENKPQESTNEKNNSKN